MGEVCLTLVCWCLGPPASLTSPPGRRRGSLVRLPVCTQGGLSLAGLSCIFLCTEDSVYERILACLLTCLTALFSKSLSLRGDNYCRTADRRWDEWILWWHVGGRGRGGRTASGRW